MLTSSWYEQFITVLQRTVVCQLNFERSLQTSTDFSHIRFLQLRFSFQGNYHISYTITDEVKETSTHHIGSLIYLLCKTNIWNYKNKSYTCMLQQLKMWTTYQQSYDYYD
jgi:hypothetical protein